MFSPRLMFSRHPTSSTQECQTLMPVVPVLAGSEHACSPTFAPMDLASNRTITKIEVADALSLEGPIEIVPIGKAVGPFTLQPVKGVNLCLSSVNENFKFLIENAWVIDSFEVANLPIDIAAMVREWPHLASIPICSKKLADVSIIIGSDYPGLQEV